VVLSQRPAALRGRVTGLLSGQLLPGVCVALVGPPGGAATDALG